MTDLPSAYVVEVRGLIHKVKNGPAPVASAEKLLLQVGCRVHSFRSTKIVPFTPPFALYPELVEEALLVVCDLYGRRRSKPTIGLTSMLSALRHRDIWRRCLAEPHDPYAFVHNMCAVLLDTSAKLETHVVIYNMLRAWVAPSEPVVRAHGRIRVSLGATEFIAAPKWENDLPGATKKLIGAIFGHHWVHFNEDSAGVFDPNLIVKMRPAFLPGLVDAPSSLEDSVPLPSLD